MLFIFLLSITIASSILYFSFTQVIRPLALQLPMFPALRSKNRTKVKQLKNANSNLELAEVDIETLKVERKTHQITEEAYDEVLNPRELYK